MITIRDANIDDTEIITRFSAELARETEEIVLNQERLREGVKALLSDPVKGRYFLAETGGEIAGQTAVTYEWSDWRNGMFWWIQSVFIPEEHRKKGVYRSLYNHIIEQAKVSGAAGIRLYVEKENHRAQQAYHNLGMKECQYQMFETSFQEFW